MEALITQKKGICSIEVGPNGVAIAYATDAAKPEITICDFQFYQNNEQFSYDRFRYCLTQIASKYAIKKSLCNWVLHPDYYRLTLTNTPNVPLSEYKKAVRWQIKDIITYPLEDVTVDIFYPDEMEKTLKKIYVVTAQNSFLQKIVNIIQDCELYPVAVDIREFAIRNLIANLAISDETTCLLSIINESCLIVLTNQQNIQFVRRIPINLKNIQNNIYDDLILELQRSFNYCQTELNQKVPTKFFMLPKADFEQTVAQNLAQNLNKEITIFDLQKVADFKVPLSPQLESSCWVAIGGALRNMV